MKSSLLFFALVCIIGSAAAQTKTPASSGNCFKDWYTTFRDRGAEPIADGTHDVVISLRNGDYAECFLGKVDVAGGLISGQLMVKKVDGSYEEFDKKASASLLNSENKLKEEMRTITNGMSTSVALSDGEIIRLFFYNALKGKPKGNAKAPSPSQLIK